MKRKLQLGYAVLVFALVLMFGAQTAYASLDPSDAWTGNTENSGETENTETEIPVYKVTIRFKANGGKGSMNDLVVESGK